MNKTLVIVGAGGHGRVVSDIALSCAKYTDIVFLDDSDKLSVPVVGKVSEYKKYIPDCDFVVAIGNNLVRERIMREMLDAGACFATLVHSAATIGSDAKIGRGSVVMAGAVINNGAFIGDGVIINTCASVDHDSVVADFCHISVGAHIAGMVRIGKRSFICAGATVINNVAICDDCTIGAGAVVINEIVTSGTYVGVPAKKILR